MSEVFFTPTTPAERKVAAEWKAFFARMERGADGYTLTREDYRKLYLAQDGRCFICRKAKGKHPDDPRGHGGRRLGVDHNHTTGLVRGLLCTGGDKTCNRVIGWLSYEALQRAVAYLERPPALSVLYGGPQPCCERGLLYPGIHEHGAGDGGTPQGATPAPRKRYLLSRKAMAEVAGVYRSAIADGEPPTQAVAEHFSVPHRTATRWVARARELGELGAAIGPTAGEASA